MGALVERVKTNWQVVFITAVLSVTGTLIYSQGQTATRPELGAVASDLRDLGRDIASIDRRLSRIEGQLVRRKYE